MTYYASLPLMEIMPQGARLLEPPFRVIKHVPGAGVLAEFGEEGIAPLREVLAALDTPCLYVWDGMRQSYRVTATDMQPARKLKPGRNRQVLRRLERRAKWAALDKSLCEGVTEPTVIPDGRVPFFWQYKRFTYVRPGQERPFRYSLRSPKGKGAYPLVVYLHSAGGFGVNGVKAVVEIGLLPQLLFKRCRVLVPQVGLGPMYDSEEFAQDLREAIERVPRVDNTRIYIAGTSYGGYGAIMECRRHPDRYAACVTSVAALANLRDPLSGEDFDALARIPMWLGYSRDEQPENEPVYEALKARGADVKQTYIKRFRHGPAGPVFWLTKPWARWLFSKHK